MIGKQVSTIFLRLVIFGIGVLVLAVCIIGLPWIAKDVSEYYPAYLLYPIFAVFYLSAIPFFFALYQSLKLLSYIDNNTAFSESSVKALKNIKYSAVIFSVLYVIISPVLYMIAEVDDAPGIILIALIFIGASIVVAVFAAVLEKLLKNAIDIKSENEFTV